MQLDVFTPRKPFLILACGAVAGVVVADRWPVPLMWPLGGCALLGAVLLRWPKTWLCLLFSTLAFFALHILRHHRGPAQDLAVQFADGPHPVELSGVVWSEPDALTSARGEARAQFIVRIESLRIEDGGTRTRGSCLVRWAGRAPAYGDEVRVRGTGRALQRATNPGEFDTAGWLRRRGVGFELAARNPSDCMVTGEGGGLVLMDYAIRARAWVKAGIERGIEDSPELASLIESMVLGLRGETPPEMKALFQKTGTLHLFAVSGLNVAMLAGIAWYLLKPLRVSRAAAFFIIVPLLAAYAVVAGLTASCVRATVMAAFVLAAPLFERPAIALNSFAAAAVAILAWDTNQLFAPGFQLSFVLVLFIMGLTAPISRRLEPVAKPDDFVPVELWSRAQRLRVGGWRQLCQAAGVTVSAWLGSVAFMAGYFHLVSPVAIVANAVAVPLAFCVLALGLMSLAVAFIAEALSVVVNQANWLVAKALLGSLALFSAVPGGYRYVEVPRMSGSPLCDVTCLDVGEGAAIHLRAGGGDWLVDCGGARDYSGILLPYLRSRGVNRLDGVILTHGDSGHIGGLVALFDDLTPRWIADTIFQDLSPTRREVHLALQTRGFGRRYMGRGDEIHLVPGVKLAVLYPPPAIGRSVSDDKAMCLRLEAAGRRVLFVSDAGFSTEEWLMRNEGELHADVLVKGWHSADLSGTPDFLARVQPGVIVSTAMRFGSTEAQALEWQRQVGAAGAALFAQDKCGAVRIEVAGDGELVVRPFIGGQIFRSRAR